MDCVAESGGAMERGVCLGVAVIINWGVNNQEGSIGSDRVPWIITSPSTLTLWFFYSTYALLKALPPPAPALEST